MLHSEERPPTPGSQGGNNVAAACPSGGAIEGIGLMNYYNNVVQKMDIGACSFDGEERERFEGYLNLVFKDLCGKDNGLAKAEFGSLVFCQYTTSSDMSMLISRRLFSIMAVKKLSKAAADRSNQRPSQADDAARAVQQSESIIVVEQRRFVETMMSLYMPKSWEEQAEIVFKLLDGKNCGRLNYSDVKIIISQLLILKKASHRRVLQAYLEYFSKKFDLNQNKYQHLNNEDLKVETKEEGDSSFEEEDNNFFYHQKSVAGLTGLGSMGMNAVANAPSPNNNLRQQQQTNAVGTLMHQPISPCDRLVSQPPSTTNQNNNYGGFGFATVASPNNCHQVSKSPPQQQAATNNHYSKFRAAQASNKLQYYIGRSGPGAALIPLQQNHNLLSPMQNNNNRLKRQKFQQAALQMNVIRNPRASSINMEESESSYQLVAILRKRIIKALVDSLFGIDEQEVRIQCLMGDKGGGAGCKDDWRESIQQEQNIMMTKEQFFERFATEDQGGGVYLNTHATHQQQQQVQQNNLKRSQTAERIHYTTTAGHNYKNAMPDQTGVTRGYTTTGGGGDKCSLHCSDHIVQLVTGYIKLFFPCAYYFEREFFAPHLSKLASAAVGPTDFVLQQQHQQNQHLLPIMSSITNQMHQLMYRQSKPKPLPLQIEESVNTPPAVVNKFRIEIQSDITPPAPLTHVSCNNDTQAIHNYSNEAAVGANTGLIQGINPSNDKFCNMAINQGINLIRVQNTSPIVLQNHNKKALPAAGNQQQQLKQQEGADIEQKTPENVGSQEQLYIRPPVRRNLSNLREDIKALKTLYRRCTIEQNWIQSGFTQNPLVRENIFKPAFLQTQNLCAQFWNPQLANSGNIKPQSSFQLITPKPLPQCSKFASAISKEIMLPPPPPAAGNIYNQQQVPQQRFLNTQNSNQSQINLHHVFKDRTPNMRTSTQQINFINNNWIASGGQNMMQQHSQQQIQHQLQQLTLQQRHSVKFNLNFKRPGEVEKNIMKNLPPYITNNNSIGANNNEKPQPQQNAQKALVLPPAFGNDQQPPPQQQPNNCGPNQNIGDQNQNYILRIRNQSERIDHKHFQFQFQNSGKRHQPHKIEEQKVKQDGINHHQYIFSGFKSRGNEEEQILSQSSFVSSINPDDMDEGLDYEAEYKQRSRVLVTKSNFVKLKSRSLPPPISAPIIQTFQQASGLVNYYYYQQGAHPLMKNDVTLKTHMLQQSVFKQKQIGTMQSYYESDISRQVRHQFRQQDSGMRKSTISINIPRMHSETPLSHQVSQQVQRDPSQLDQQSVSPQHNNVWGLGGLGQNFNPFYNQAQVINVNNQLKHSSYSLVNNLATRNASYKSKQSYLSNGNQGGGGGGENKAQLTEKLTIKPSKKMREMSGLIGGQLIVNCLEKKDSNFVTKLGGNIKSQKIIVDDVRSCTEKRQSSLKNFEPRNSVILGMPTNNAVPLPQNKTLVDGQNPYYESVFKVRNAENTKVNPKRFKAYVLQRKNLSNVARQTDLDVLQCLYLETNGPNLLAYKTKECTTPILLHNLPSCDSFSLSQQFPLNMSQSMRNQRKNSDKLIKSHLKIGSVDAKLPSVECGLNGGSHKRAPIYKKSNSQVASMKIINLQQRQQQEMAGAIDVQGLKFTCEVSINLGKKSGITRRDKGFYKRKFYFKKADKAKAFLEKLSEGQLHNKNNTSKFEDNYKIKDDGEGAAALIGEGSYGKVYLAYKVYDLGKEQLYAVKVMNKGKMCERELIHCKSEIEYLHLMTDEAHKVAIKSRTKFVQIEDYFEDAQEIKVVLKFIEGINLAKWITGTHREKNYPEKDAKFIIKQLVSDLKELHNLGLIHRDVKLENIILNETTLNPTLVDYGLMATLLKGQRRTEMLGSVAYMSPEIAARKAYDSKTDVWGLGICLYALLTGRMPFVSSCQKQTLENIVKQEINLKQAAWLQVSAEAKDLVSQMLQKDPNLRPSCEQVQQHRWLQDN